MRMAIFFIIPGVEFVKGTQFIGLNEKIDYGRLKSSVEW
jgi:hypothetical protein